MTATPLALLLSAITLGAVTGITAPAVGSAFEDLIDLTIFVLLVMLFLPLTSEHMRHAVRNLRFTSVAWVTNFLIAAPLGAFLAWAFLNGHPAAMAGLIIYFAAPCTDWYLAFTKLAGGATAEGAALIPVNLATQALLFPVIVWFAADEATGMTLGAFAETLAIWFALPLAVAGVLRAAITFTKRAAAFHLQSDRLALAVLTLLVFEIFAAHTPAIVETVSVVPVTLAAVAVFFLSMLAISVTLGRAAHLPQPERTALTMTASARNAPLMLALTMAALPDQPVMYAVIVTAMLAEFPHLSLLAHALRRRRRDAAGADAAAPRTRVH